MSAVENRSAAQTCFLVSLVATRHSSCCQHGMSGAESPSRAPQRSLDLSLATRHTSPTWDLGFEIDWSIDGLYAAAQ